MKYNLADNTQLVEAFDYLSDLAQKEKVVEITRKDPNRSLPQNAYLHLLLGAFGMNFGYTLEEAKQIYKEVNKSLYYYEKNNRTFKRSSADLDKKQMAESIDRFMKVSAEAGYELPLAEDKEYLMQIENEIERSRKYL